MAGALLFAARLVESFDDALIGWWSDRTRSRLGRRIPFVLPATPLWALFGFLLFTPPADAGRFATGLYLFLVLELFAAGARSAQEPEARRLPALDARGGPGLPAPLLRGLRARRAGRCRDPRGGALAGAAVSGIYLSFRRYELPDDVPVRAVAARAARP